MGCRPLTSRQTADQAEDTCRLFQEILGTKKQIQQECLATVQVAAPGLSVIEDAQSVENRTLVNNLEKEVVAASCQTNAEFDPFHTMLC